MFIFDKTDAVRGKFLNKVITAWEGNRDMVLHSPFSYRDSNGKLWTAPARAKINGASIPRLLWVLGVAKRLDVSGFSVAAAVMTGFSPMTRFLFDSATVRPSD